MAKHFTPEFKLEAAKLVVDHGYTYVKAAEAVNVSHSAIPRWVNKLRLERQEKTPAGLIWRWCWTCLHVNRWAGPCRRHRTRH
ncbi:transposase [Candidatus Erwinia dacicola]